MRRLWQFYNGRGAYQTARELGEQCLQLAQQGHDTAHLLEAHHTLWTTRLLLGALPRARVHLEQGLALYDPQQHRALAVCYGHDPGVCCQGVAALTLWLLGYPDQARRQQHAMHILAQELAHPPSLAFTMMLAAIAHQLRREADAAHGQAEALLALATEQGFALFVAMAMILRGGALTVSGPRGEQISQLCQGLAAVRATGAALWGPYFLALQAEAYAQAGQVEAGLAALAESLTAVQTTRECWGEAELHRLKGDLLLQASVPGLESAVAMPHAAPRMPPAAEAEACFQQALAIARRHRRNPGSCAPRSACHGSGDGRTSRLRRVPCSCRSMAGSRRALRPPTSRRPRRCWRNWHRIAGIPLKIPFLYLSGSPRTCP